MTMIKFPPKNSRTVSQG